MSNANAETTKQLNPVAGMIALGLMVACGIGIIATILGIMFGSGTATRQAREACASIGATLHEGREWFCVTPDGTLKVVPGVAETPSDLPAAR